MRAPVLDVRTCTDGSVILRPHGSIGPATCGLGDDQRVAVFVDNSSSVIAAQLTAAGVPRQRFRGGADQSSPS